MNKRAYCKKILHYQPFVVKSVYFSKCKQFFNTAIQKSINPKDNKPIKNPPIQKKQLYSSKSNQRESVSNFRHWCLNNIWGQVLHMYAAQMFSFVPIFTDQQHFSAQLRSPSSRCIRRLQWKQSKHKQYGRRRKTTKSGKKIENGLTVFQKYSYK